MFYRQTNTVPCGLLFTLILCCGCVDGPMYTLKSINPYYRAQWKEDKAHGPTFDERLEELALLREKVKTMDAASQAEWATQLETIIASDPSPEMRYRAVQTIGYIEGDTSVRALNRASADEVEKVRLAACEAWQLQQNDAARDMLLSMSRESETTSVRQAAIESLAAFDQAEVKRGLGTLLDDPSPAIQYQVASSLSEMTGKNYGGDFAAWKQYLAGNEVPEPGARSLTAQAVDLLPKF